MKTSHRYATATAFRIALEARLKSLAQAEGIDLQRLRRQVSFDRLLARLFSEPNTPWLLKGGYAMELRLRSARTTKDIDLSLPGEVEEKGNVRATSHPCHSHCTSRSAGIMATTLRATCR